MTRPCLKTKPIWRFAGLSQTPAASPEVSSTQGGGPASAPAELFQDLETPLPPTEGMLAHQPYLRHITDENGGGGFHRGPLKL